MRSIITTLTLFCSFAGLVLSAEQLAQLSVADDIEDTALLRLDYGTYRGYYNETNEVYVFKNIRYAAPPVGYLRWAKPALPAKRAGIQDGKDGSSCTQPVMEDVLTTQNAYVGPGREDCLFLDLTIPRKVFDEPWLKLPVLVWIHGGYYTVGSKDERSFYQFDKPYGGNIISVAVNYRLGLYGFLGGSTVEREGLPNAGLWDQRAALEWVQTYIPSIGGDKNQVTAMGVSAGAGSILHHLVAEGGKLDPLFRRAIVQSPGYATVLDRAGEVEQKFKRMEEYLGCQGNGLVCMRSVSEEALQSLSASVNSGFKPGSSGWDPILDGRFIMNTPVLEIQSDRYWKNMHSIISGYALDEGAWFIDPSINTTEKFDDYVRSTFSNRTDFTKLKERLNTLYPPPELPGSSFQNTLTRLSLYVGDSGFNCHNRMIAEAYPNKTFTYQASLSGGFHYVDQAPSFFDSNARANSYMPESEKISVRAFQSYLVSEITSGNPNTLRNEATIEWPSTSGIAGKTLMGVLSLNNAYGPSGLSIIPSPRLVKDRCDFWSDVYWEKQKLLTKSLKGQGN